MVARMLIFITLTICVPISSTSPGLMVRSISKMMPDTKFCAMFCIAKPKANGEHRAGREHGAQLDAGQVQGQRQTRHDEAVVNQAIGDAQVATRRLRCCPYAARDAGRHAAPTTAPACPRR